PQPWVRHVRRPRGEVDADLRAVAASAGDGGRQRRRHVDHEKISGREEVGQVAKAGMRERAARTRRYQQANVVPGKTACLGGLARLEFPRELERERAHTGTDVSSRAR